MIRQRHAGQRFKALREMDLLGDSSDYCRASVLVKHCVGAFEEVRECLAVLAVANGATRYTWDDIAFDRAASALHGMVHFSKAIRCIARCIEPHMRKRAAMRGESARNARPNTMRPPRTTS